MQLDQYTWDPEKDKIAEGSFAEVFKAKDEYHQSRTVALKIYKEAIAKGTQGATGHKKYSLEEEFLKTDGLSHTNLISYFGLRYMHSRDAMGRDSSYPALVMEYATEGTLMDFMNTNPSDEVIAKLIHEIILGVSYLHEEGIIHRDLKPGNVLITKSRNGRPVAKITDFGISKDILQEQKIEQSFTEGVGTPHYMAPEQFFKKTFGSNQEIGVECDVWAIGVIIYRLLTGKLPFGNGTKDHELIREDITDKEPDLSGLSVNHQKALSGCFQKHAKDRITILELLKVDWITSDEIAQEDTQIIPENNSSTIVTHEQLVPETKAVKDEPEDVELIKYKNRFISEKKDWFPNDTSEDLEELLSDVDGKMMDKLRFHPFIKPINYFFLALFGGVFALDRFRTKEKVTAITKIFGFPAIPFLLLVTILTSTEYKKFDFNKIDPYEFLFLILPYFLATIFVVKVTWVLIDSITSLNRSKKFNKLALFQILNKYPEYYSGLTRSWFDADRFHKIHELYPNFAKIKLEYITNKLFDPKNVLIKVIFNGFFGSNMLYGGDALLGIFRLLWLIFVVVVTFAMIIDGNRNFSILYPTLLIITFLDIIALIRIKKWNYERFGEYSKDTIKEISGNKDSFIPFQKKNKWGYINQFGLVEIKPEFKTARAFNEDVAVVQKFTDKYGLIATNRDCILPFKYEEMEECSEGIIAAKLDGKWGYYTKTSSIIIPHIYDRANQFEDGKAVVWQGDQKMIIDKKGNVVEEL